MVDHHGMTTIARLAAATVALGSIVVLGTAGTAGAAQTIPARVEMMPAQQAPAEPAPADGAGQLLVVGGAALLGLGSVSVVAAAPRRRRVTGGAAPVLV